LNHNLEINAKIVKKHKKNYKEIPSMVMSYAHKQNKQLRWRSDKVKNIAYYKF